ncbi:hypothetical protein [Streptomyces sp. NBC_00878]|uniref:hypothetical protein n=1 Tax=Streptomyces sp. NBC_00878 TaxID=2975854 RepID=UPI00225B935E|nr:hypothetical protein [Streptomyces sp. NBC_00878]MCX4904459.1 hypothetical protein [Streptomyces sp. NBC_00878]
MARFQVYISDEGLAEIDSDPVVAAPGRSVHEAVLDRLQRYAQERDADVEATVNDSLGAAHFVLQVSPDGSSRIIAAGEGRDTGEAGEGRDTGEAGEVPPVESEAAPATTVPPPASALSTAVARASAAARTHTPAPTGVAEPTELAEHIGRINALAATGRLDEAFADATALRESLTGSVGAGHPHSVEARGLEAYLAHLRGDHREAVVLALAVARIRCGAGDEQASVDVARATAAWQHLVDDLAVVTHGHELLHMWDMLSRRGPLPPGHAELAGQVRRHVEGLEGAYV